VLIDCERGRKEEIGPPRPGRRVRTGKRAGQETVRKAAL
jgi:hypothetical protein